MCIIAAKPAGVERPCDDYMFNMFDTNSDGAGVMWADGKKVHIQKGFMDWDSFEKFLTQFEKTHDTKKLSMVFHFRITTHGGTSKQNCHPFPVSDSKGMLQKLVLTTDVGVAHNGIIHIEPDKGMSDTMTYIAKQMAPLKRSNPKFYKDKNLLQLIENAIESKMAILDAKGSITLIGDFVEEDGVKYSNTSYQYPKWFGQSFTWSSWDDYRNPDKWEIGSGMKGFTHKRVMWLPWEEGFEVYDEQYNPIYEAAIDAFGNIYEYDDDEGALIFVPHGLAIDSEGKDAKYDPEGWVVDELVVETY